MAYIDYRDLDRLPAEERVPDTDNILRIHSVNGRVMRQHYDLYRQLMYGPGPLTRIQREMLAVAVSAANACHY